MKRRATSQFSSFVCEQHFTKSLGSLSCPRGYTECEFHNKFMELCAKGQLSNWKQPFENLYLQQSEFFTFSDFAVITGRLYYEMLSNQVEHSLICQLYEKMNIIALTSKSG